MVNYLEHYGLQRRKDANGVYESIGCMCSWNAVSSPVAFRIQRHSDHHAHVFRPYQILRRFDKAPTMPYEYIIMLFIGLVPPLFFYLMDPRVKSINDAKSGIHNSDQWNNEQPMSDADKKRHTVVMVFLTFASICITGLLLI